MTTRQPSRLDLLLPSTFEVQAQGTVDGVVFGPVAGTIELEPPWPGSPDPLVVSLRWAATTARPSIGDLSWIAGAHGLTPDDQGRYQVQAEVDERGAVVRARLDAPDGALAVSCWTAVEHPALAALGHLSPTVTTAAALQLHLPRQGPYDVEGTLEARGLRGEAVSNYRAHLVGHRRLP